MGAACLDSLYLPSYVHMLSCALFEVELIAQHSIHIKAPTLNLFWEWDIDNVVNEDMVFQPQACNSHSKNDIITMQHF